MTFTWDITNIFLVYVRTDEKMGHNIKIFLYMSKFFTEFVFQKPEKGLWVENIRAQ